MRPHLSLLICALFLFHIGLANAAAQSTSEQSFENVTSVSDGIGRIRSSLESQGFEILATINHGAAANSVGLDLRPTQVILFSKPRLDRALIRRSQIAALDLPLKFLVFEDEKGKIQLRFNPPGFLIDRHDIPVFDGLTFKLDRVLSQFGRLENGVELVSSSQSVEKTVEKLLGILRDRGFRIPAVINFSERAHRQGKNLRDTQLILFGNPDVGTPLMKNNQSIGLDLPQKFLVFEKQRGQVFIVFNDPRFLAEKHSLQRDQDPGDLDVRLENIANALRGLAQAGAQPTP